MISGNVIIEKKSVPIGKNLIDRAMKAAMLTVYGDVKIRVFNEQGATLTSGAKAGVYKSKQYVAKRLADYGRTNKNISFVYSGDLNRNFTFERRAYNIYVMGFSEMGNKEEISNAKKYDYLVEKFGQIAQLNQKEIKRFTQVFNDSL